MSNPFDDKDGIYLALVNHEGQYSLWPASIDIPPGWTVAHPKDSREACVNFINQTWTDMRPRSLIDAMNAQAATSSATQPGDHNTPLK